MDNIHRTATVPSVAEARSTPAMWLVRNGHGPRRLARRGRQLRTVVGYDTIVTRTVEAIDLDDVVACTVLAPYAPPAPRALLTAGGLAAGCMVGSGLAAADAAATAVAVLTFGMVATVVSGQAAVGRRLARIEMTTGPERMMAYAIEDEEEVAATFGTAWRPDPEAPDPVPLDDEEGRRTDAVRIGIVLAVSAAAMLVVMAGGGNGADGWTGAGVAIMRIVAMALAGGLAAVAWYKLVLADIRHRLANRARVSDGPNPWQPWKRRKDPSSS